MDEAKIIVKNRKKLSKVAPLTFSICVGFALTNILIGIAFFTLSVRQLPFIIIRGVFTPQLWGMIFWLLSVVGIVTLITNSWKHIRMTLMAGLFIKALWLYALIPTIKSGGLGTVSIWAFIGYVQLMTVVLFPEEG